MTARSNAAADSVQRELTITRMFDAPRELVFKAWTDPKHVARWWGPKDLGAFKQTSEKSHRILSKTLFYNGFAGLELPNFWLIQKPNCWETPPTPWNPPSARPTRTQLVIKGPVCMP